MALSTADFKLKYPEFDSVSDPSVQLCLDEAAIIVDLSVCPDLADLMQGSYAAHCVAKSSLNPSGIDDAPGPAQSKSVGAVSISYGIATGSVSVSNDWFRSTVYGQNFLRFRNMCFPAVLVTG